MRTTGLFDFWKKKAEPKKGFHYAPTMTGELPFFSSFGDNIYASDIIVQSIRCTANEFKKLNPRHIRTGANGVYSVTDSSIAKVLKRPNPYMTTADFLEKIKILLELNKNVFIYPTYYITKGGEKYYTGLYPLKPSQVQYLADDKGELYIQFNFANGTEIVLPQNEVIHWRKDFGASEYFGGNAFGGNDDVGLLTMLKRYDELTQSIAKAVQCSCQINGIVQYNSYNDNEKLQAEREKFEASVKENKSGLLFLDLKQTYTPISRDVKLVDKDTLQFFYDTILRANGTPLCILNGTYSKSDKESFYEHSLEADIKSLGQAMSKVLFSDREEAFGNEIVLYPNEIQFMSMENKIAALQTGLPAGIFTKDEARELLGYPPLPNGAGQVVPQGYNNLLDDENNNSLNGANAQKE